MGNRLVGRWAPAKKDSWPRRLDDQGRRQAAARGYSCTVKQPRDSSVEAVGVLRSRWTVIPAVFRAEVETLDGHDQQGSVEPSPHSRFWYLHAGIVYSGPVAGLSGRKGSLRSFVQPGGPSALGSEADFRYGHR